MSGWRASGGRARPCWVGSKWNPDAFDGFALKAFRGYYPHGCNFLVTPAGDPPYTKRFGGLEVRICTPTELVP